MTDRALEELAARVEALTGPDREVDIAILTGVLGYRDIHGDRTLFDRGNDGYWSLDGDEMNPPLPSPTASIDAAMSLIDPTWFFHLSRFSPDCDSRSEAHIYPNRGLGDDYRAEAHSPPLALTAACLRAIASASEQQENPNDGE